MSVQCANAHLPSIGGDLLPEKIAFILVPVLTPSHAPPALGVSGKPDIPYFTPSAQIAISAVPRSVGTAQALHTVSRTWLRGGSPHRILKKLPVRHATLLRRQGVSVL